MTRLTLAAFVACWSLALVGEVAQTPARRVDELVQEAV